MDSMLAEIMAGIERFKKPPAAYYDERGLHQEIFDTVYEAADPLTQKQVAERIREAVAAGRYPEPDQGISVRRVNRDSRFLIVCGLVERSKGRLYMDAHMKESVGEYLRVIRIRQEMV